METAHFEQHLPRIASMAAGDEAMYYLALHSFVEGYVNACHPELRSAQFSFYNKVQALADDLHGEGLLSPAVRRTLGALRSGHSLTNDIRHDFANVTREEVRAATHTFLSLCRTIGFAGAGVGAIESSLPLWDGKRTPLEMADEVRTLRLQLNHLRRDYRAIEPRVAELDQVSRSLEAATAALVAQDVHLSELETRVAARGKKADEARAAAHAAQEERRRLEREADALRSRLEALGDVQSHIAYLERFTAYTRSRADFERSVLELSEEQREAAERALLPGDYLVTGAAGTGKTLVLLHALDRDLAGVDEELGIVESKPFALLTYTKTLVRFNRYLNSIVGSHSASPVIATVDAFLLERLRAVWDGAYVAFSGNAQDVFEPILEPFIVGDLTFEVLWHELEDEIFALGLTRDDYVNGPVAGALVARGGDRETVWKAAEACFAFADETGAFSKNHASMAIQNAVVRDDALRRRLSVRRIYVDETQDLSPADLSTLKLLTTDGIVMAGDPNQAIYRLGSTFKAAGINIQGRTRHLKRNYRNTAPIVELAERFHGMGEGPAVDRPAAPIDAARDGPEPELYVAPDREAGLDLLVRRVGFFLRRLAYDPENLAVLVSSRDDVGEVRSRCKAEGIAVSNPKSDTFDFESTAGVRVTTMHSAKGVEFPVVFLFLPGFSVRDGEDPRDTLQKQRNLLYVALTRAMDNVQVVTVEPLQAGAISDLAAICGYGVP